MGSTGGGAASLASMIIRSKALLVPPSSKITLRDSIKRPEAMDKAAYLAFLGASGQFVTHLVRDVGKRAAAENAEAGDVRFVAAPSFFGGGNP